MPTALALSRRLRRAGLVVDLGFAGSLAKGMKRANKVNARVAVILGEAEIARQVATVRDMDSGAQREVSLAQLEDELGQYC
jgi:histidyl-tRNA synthetase